jgi:aromatic ring-opening dioxygenase catalytic subunit (LigB family)
MGTVLKAGALSHLPEVFGYVDEDPTSKPAWPQMRSFLRGVAELGKRVRAAQPDVLIMSFDEHYVAPTPDFMIINGARHAGTLEMFGIEFDRTYPGHPELAAAIYERARQAGLPVRMQAAPDWGVFDFALLIPLIFMGIDRDIPVVPVMVHYLPEISLERCVQMGQVIRDLIGERPENAVVIGDGGLSHYIGYPEKWDQIDVEWDRQFLRALEEGRARDLAHYTHDELEEVGNDEVRQWLLAASTVEDGTRAEVLAYEPATYFGLGVGAAVVDLKP